MKAASNPPGLDIVKVLTQLNLKQVCESARCIEIDRLDAHYEGRQYDHLRYSWDGGFIGSGDAFEIMPEHFIPMKHRRPSMQIAMSRLITQRLTAMMLGEGRFPTVSVEGDSDAEDYVQALIEESSLKARLVEAREQGGVTGTAILSVAFVAGKPRVQCHRSRHIHVLRWADRYELRPAEVLKVYSYARESILDQGAPKRCYFVRYWSETLEITWDAVPEDVATKPGWAEAVTQYTVAHGHTQCPVYFIQNLPSSECERGISDSEGLLDNFDEINRLLSATTKGTAANVDPTVVIKADPIINSGSVRKGSDNAIFSPGGAEYLELSGSAVETAKSLLRALIQYCLDVASVVIGDAEFVSGSARSAAAMRMLYQPMTNQCDKLRGQYGTHGILPIVKGMLAAAREAEGANAGAVITTEDGRVIQEHPVVQLEPRAVSEIEEGPDGARSEVTRYEPRKPGTSSRVTLKWDSYFKPSVAETDITVTAALKARGILISNKTAIKAIQSIYAVADVEQELLDIEADKAMDALMHPGPDLGLVDDAAGEGAQVEGPVDMEEPEEESVDMEEPEEEDE